MDATTENKVELRQFFPASRERVYAAWTDLNEMKRWFGGGGLKDVQMKADFRVGGRYAIDVTRDDGEIWTAAGEYREIEPPARLVYTWRWEDDEAWDGLESLITVEFIEKPGGTEIHLLHEGFPSGESRGNHEGGWRAALEKLAALMA